MEKKKLKAENKKSLYVASCSFGKDSIATILLALEHGEPLDRVVFSEVMFDKTRNISGENPEHIKWVYSEAIPKLETMGVKVDVVRADRDYIDEFFHVCTKGKRKGFMRGFPMQGRCVVNSNLKIKPIKDYYKKMSQEYDVVQYIGIALDEPLRLERLHQYDDRISLLEKYGYTEADAYELCDKHGLLSPLYQSVSRGGCWFCPSARVSQFAYVRKNYPWLWGKLREMSKSPNLISSNLKFNMSFEEVERRMDAYEEKMKNQGKTI